MQDNNFKLYKALIKLHFLFCYYYSAGIGGSDAGSLFGSEQNFSKEVDDKANSYFQAIYNRGMSVDRLLEELKKFKDSPNKKDRVSYKLKTK